LKSFAVAKELPYFPVDNARVIYTKKRPKDACSTTPGYAASDRRTSANDYIRTVQNGLWTRFKILSQHLPERTGENHENCADS
jgi:hypothetical protein